MHHAAQNAGPRLSAAGDTGDTRRQRGGSVAPRALGTGPGVIGRASAADVRGARTLPMTGQPGVSSGPGVLIAAVGKYGLY